MLDEKGFAAFLKKRGLSQVRIDESLAAMREFEAFLSSGTPRRTLETITAKEVHAFSRALIGTKRNTREAYFSLIHYGWFSGNHRLTVHAIELLDGAEVLDRLYEKVGTAIGEAQRDAVFAELSPPPLGTPPPERPALTQAFLERLEERVDRTTWTRLLADGLRDLSEASYDDAKRLFLESDDLDDYLERKGRAFLAELREIQRAGGLYFTQEVTDAVIDFVESNPEIRQGVRHGNVLYETKIPYMTTAYLEATDVRTKRYAACHCPWVRESLRTGERSVSPDFCLCSAGFHKKPWEVLFGVPLTAEVVESILKGDLQCRFAIHLPPQAQAARSERMRM